MCLMLAVCAAATLAAAIYAVVPVFTVLAKGPSAVGLCLALAAVYAGLARAAYDRRPVGWWGTLALVGISTASGATYFGAGHVEEYFAAIGMQDQQVRLFTESGVMSPMFMAGWWLLWLGALIAYMASVRKYFVTGTANPGSS
jgi:hypothetical protein